MEHFDGEVAMLTWVKKEEEGKVGEMADCGVQRAVELARDAKADLQGSLAPMSENIWATAQRYASGRHAHTRAPFSSPV